MGNEQSLPAGGTNVPEATTATSTLTQEEKAAKFADELEKKRLESVARKKAEREAVEKETSRAEEGLKRDQKAGDETQKKQADSRAAAATTRRESGVSTSTREQERTKAALRDRIEVLNRELAAQDLRRKSSAGAGGAASPSIPIPASTLPTSTSGREHHDRVEGPNTNGAARAVLDARIVENSNGRGSRPSPRDNAALQRPAATTLPNRRRQDEGSPRRASDDSGIGMPRALEDNPRVIKAATGPSRRVSSDNEGGNDRGMAPPQSNNVKRPATAQNEDTSKRPRTTSSVPTSPQTSSAASASIVDRQPPAWYTALSFVPRRGEADAVVEPFLKTLKTKISFCKDPRTIAGPVHIREQTFNEIRRRIHELMFQTVTERLLRNNSMLHNDRGLPQLFDERYSSGVDWPFDIKADAKELYHKWCNRVFETDLLRGIIPGGKTGSNDRSSDKLDYNWPHRVSPKFHGNRNLVNGQWWPTQLAALRDGGHGSSQAGIYGEPGMGAYSCIMAGNHDYADKDDGDKDEGDVVYYCGTDSSDGKITAGTNHMIESCADGRPVRLIRSHKVQSKYAPEMGLRYDGLYDVESYERLDPVSSLRQRHRFKMVRRAGQDPIRGGFGPEKRPTQQEIEAHQKDKRLRGIAVKGKKGTVHPTWG